MGFLPWRFSPFINKSPCQLYFLLHINLVSDLFVLPYVLHVNRINWLTLLINWLIHHKGSIHSRPIILKYCMKFQVWIFIKLFKPKIWYLIFPTWNLLFFPCFILFIAISKTLLLHKIYRVIKSASSSRDTNIM